MQPCAGSGWSQQALMCAGRALGSSESLLLPMLHHYLHKENFLQQVCICRCRSVSGRRCTPSPCLHQFLCGVISTGTNCLLFTRAVPLRGWICFPRGFGPCYRLHYSASIFECEYTGVERWLERMLAVGLFSMHTTYRHNIFQNPPPVCFAQSS